MRVAVSLLILTGCGRIGFVPGGDAGGSGPFDGRDAADAQQLGMFATPVEVAAFVGSFDDDDPALSADGLELFYASGQAGNNDIWVSTRASVTDPWPASIQIAELATAADEKSPELSDDGLTMWFDKGGDIVETQRATRTSLWSAPVIVLTSALTYSTPTVCDADRKMFVRIGQSATGEKIGVTSRATVTDSWPLPAAVPELSLGFLDSGAWATSDCKRLYYDSNVSGDQRVYVTDYNDGTSTFDPPVEVTELSVASSNVHDVGLTSDQRTLVYSRRMAGFEHIWQSSR